MKVRWYLVFLLVICAVPASAYLDYILVEPPEPEAGEPFTITVFGYLPNSCWSLLSYQCIEVTGQEIVLEIHTYDCQGRGCENCAQVLTPFAHMKLQFPDRISFVLSR